MFGGPAWTHDAPTAQWYYHGFLAQQPDLNWRNPEVVDAMLDVLRFWFERGVDGFRIDVLWLLLKDEVLRDDLADGWRSRADLPGILDLVARMRSVADAYPDRVLIGEIYLPLERLVRYYGEHGDGVHLPFNFQLITLPWDATAIGAAIVAYEAALPRDAWPNWVLGNHDQSRVASRVGPVQARAAAVLLLTLRGTPTIYYGDEIGMTDVAVPPERRVDPAGTHGPSRDPERAPLRWSPGPGGGFTTVEPWLPLPPDAPRASIDEQRDAPGSMLTLHRRLLALRRAEPALAVGDVELIEARPDGLLCYRRTLDGRSIIVALDVGASPVDLAHPSIAAGRVLVGADPGRRDGEILGSSVRLAPGEGLVIEPVET